MKADDIFIGPLLRRAQPDLVVICLATYLPLKLRFSLREHGATTWLAHDAAPQVVKVTPSLYFHFARIRPERALRTGVVLAYGIGVKQGDDYDYAQFEAIVQEDQLAYAKAPLPTFVLQAKNAPLNILYGSCRKIHDTKGGKRDTLADGDAQLERTFLTPAKRPTILCMGGDQIYADDVDILVRDQVTILTMRLEGKQVESLPDAPNLWPRNRQDILKKKARFTSDDLTNHLASFCEYLALYGLMWNGRTWYSQPKALEHFTATLPKVRRLLANIPSYMVFDDHDVTDDWNLDIKWREAVYRAPLGKRIVANALMAYWLCQGYGNDPDGFGKDRTQDLVELIEQRQRRYAEAEEKFWAIDSWEFATPTSPFVYFLDTRTQRGAQDDPQAHRIGAPAFLKSVRSWQRTVGRLESLLKKQGPGVPLVLVSAAPVFGFMWIETLQELVTFFFGAYKYDFENWAANEAHFGLFLRLLAGRNVVVLSGDVHYGYSSTVRYMEFDSRRSRAGGARTTATGGLPIIPGLPHPSYRPTSTAQFVQLCSSAINNYAGGFFTSIPAWLTSTQPAKILTDSGETKYGRYENGVFIMLESDPGDPVGSRQEIRLPEEVKPVTLFRQRINDAFNSRYIGDHNLGLLSIRETSVEHCFLMDRGRASERRWDFSNSRYWE